MTTDFSSCATPKNEGRNGSNPYAPIPAAKGQITKNNPPNHTIGRVVVIEREIIIQQLLLRPSFQPTASWWGFQYLVIYIPANLYFYLFSKVFKTFRARISTHLFIQFVSIDVIMM